MKMFYFPESSTDTVLLNFHHISKGTCCHFTDGKLYQMRMRFKTLIFFFVLDFAKLTEIHLQTKAKFMSIYSTKVLSSNLRNVAASFKKLNLNSPYWTHECDLCKMHLVRGKKGLASSTTDGLVIWSPVE